jgi:hypothetical protein
MSIERCVVPAHAFENAVGSESDAALTQNNSGVEIAPIAHGVRSSGSVGGCAAQSGARGRVATLGHASFCA